MSCGSTVIGRDERAVFLKKQSKSWCLLFLSLEAVFFCIGMMGICFQTWDVILSVCLYELFFCFFGYELL
jgi:hypothetical protein